MTADDAYSLLEEANPVPDPLGYLNLLSRESPAAAPHELRKEDMQPIDVETKTADHGLRPNRRMAFAVIALVAVLATVSVVVTRETPEAASSSQAELAIQRTHDFLDARTASDLQAAAGLDFRVPQSWMTEWEWWSVFAEAGQRGEVGTCTTAGEPPSISVTCPLTATDPVMAALGVQDVELEFQFFPGAGEAGHLKVPGYIDYGGNGSAEAYGTYLSVYQSDIYAESCSPSAYESESILSSDGIAFTPECAQALVPYLDDIASWIENGRAMP
jgi:hypothetical protein